MTSNTPSIGWIGMGRMGFPMAERLLKAGYKVSIWNRTRAKAEPLAAQGGKIVKDGKTLQSPEENIAELTVDAQRFADRQIPILKSMAIV